MPAPYSCGSRNAFLFLLLIPTILAQTCWYPDGRTTQPDDFACNPGSDTSPCCGSQSDGTRAICLSNGLCLADMKLSRGSCTDKTWTSRSCAQFCQKNLPQAGWPVSSCDNKQTWTCDDCRTSNFTMSTPQLRLNAEQKASLGVTVGTATSSSSSATSSPTSTPSCAAAASSSSGTSSSSNSTPVIAVGASLGVAFLVAAGLFGWEKRKTHRLRSELQQHRAELQQRYQYSGPPVPAKTGYRQQPTETGEELQKARAATRARHELDSGSRPHGGISEADEDRGYNDRKRWP